MGVTFWIHSVDMSKVSESFCGNPVDDGFFHVKLCSYVCVSFMSKYYIFCENNNCIDKMEMINNKSAKQNYSSVYKTLR